MNIRPGKAIHRVPAHMHRGRILIPESIREVRVIAVAENYAMVRRKGAMPYVAHTREISQESKP